MKYFSRFSLIVLLLLLTPFSALSGGETESPLDIANRLQTNYESIESMGFHFSQTSWSALGGRPQQGSGEAYFLKDGKQGKMRWNYFSPDHQVLVSDGKTFSMYFSKLEQMIVSPAETMSSDLTYSFFTGSGSIPEDFFIFTPDENVGIDNTDGKFKIIKIIPKEAQSQVKDIHLWITEDSLIQRIEVKDHFETITTLNLSKIETGIIDSKDSKHVEDLFSFTPPEGTEIIEQ